MALSLSPHSAVALKHAQHPHCMLKQVLRKSGYSRVNRKRLALVTHQQSPRQSGRSQSTTGRPASGQTWNALATGRNLAQSGGAVFSPNKYLKPTNGIPQIPKARARVAVDVDEVLGRFVYSLNMFCKEKYQMEYQVGDYWIYEFAKIWGCSPEQSNHIVHEFFDSPHFNEGIPVIPGAYDALIRLSRSCDLVVVTSRQHVIQDVTLDWIDKHYPGVFSEVYFGNHFALQGTSRKKSDICRSIGARVLIDDNPTYAMECAAAGIQVLLYDWEDEYPWSKLPQEASRDNITVVRNWDEVELQLARLSPIIS